MPERRPDFTRVEMPELPRWMRGGWLWLLLAFVLVLVVVLATCRIGRVSGEEVGLLLNKLNGSVEVIPESGVRIYNGITHDFFVLDRTLQTLDMTGDESLKIKTKDGSDVHVELKVQYRIDGNMAADVLETSGPHDAFKEKWARDYIRAITRNFLGELTTEEFYDPSKRAAKVILAHNNANERLLPFGKTQPFGVPPKHVKVAQDKHRLGIFDSERIELVKIGWAEDRLI